MLNLLFLFFKKIKKQALELKLKKQLFVFLDHALAYDYNSNMSLQGTIFWMAPEVFTKGYSAKVDIWCVLLSLLSFLCKLFFFKNTFFNQLFSLCFRSLGCVVLEMFAGERPWPNLSDLAAMFKVSWYFHIIVQLIVIIIFIYQIYLYVCSLEVRKKLLQ